jgi:phenylpropionate dioxygenase-like ring-hydroxylating dioxygenase large terminal subunit
MRGERWEGMMSGVDIFESRHYRKARAPALEAETLPPWCYTAPEFYAREVERIFRKTWNFVGRADEITKPGDYLVFDLVGESVIVLRDRAGALRAFANTCRHRGTRLLSGSGRCTSIACPYHAWVYDLDGRLISSLGMEEAVGFDPASYGLLPVRLESWEGFLFVTFDDGAPPLSTHLGDLPQRFAAYNFADMVCVRRKEYDLACNWKIYVENAMEDYHTPTVHRKSIGLQQTTLETGKVGEWDAIFMPAPRTIAVLPEDIDFALPPIAGLSGKPAGGTFFTVIYPSTFFATTQDCMWWLQESPQGPGRTRVVIGSCFPRATVARSDFAEKVAIYYKRWDKALPEDNAISEQQQAGLGSTLARPGRLSGHEPAVHCIANWVLDRVLDPAPQCDSAAEGQR